MSHKRKIQIEPDKFDNAVSVVQSVLPNISEEDIKMVFDSCSRKPEVNLLPTTPK